MEFVKNPAIKASRYETYAYDKTIESWVPHLTYYRRVPFACIQRLRMNQGSPPQLPGVDKYQSNGGCDKQKGRDSNGMAVSQQALYKE